MPNKNNAPARIPECHPERKHLAHGLCKSCYDREYQLKNRKRVNAKSWQWAQSNPERRLEIRRKYHYGVEADVVRAKLTEQGGLCAVCRTAPATDFDHDHSTGKFRGMLCGNCNRGLGLFADDPNRLKRAAQYLREA